MKRSFALILLAFASVACTQTDKQVKASFFSFDSLINSQIVTLSRYKATLDKEVNINGKTETKILQPADSLAWANELEIYRQLNDLNNPISRDAYEQTTAPDSLSNLTVRLFITKGELPLKEVRIYYLQQPSAIRKIVGYINERNPLYKSARTIQMSFSEIENQTLLTSYQIQGGQHMILGDTVQFDINNNIRIK